MAWTGAQIGMTLGGLLDPPKGPVVEGPRLGDLTTQTSTYGSTIPRVYGTVAVTGNIIWLENNQLKETVSKKKSGGKGGGSKTTNRTYSYSATFAVGLADCSVSGPMVGVRRIWIGPDLWYDAGSSDSDTIVASNAAAAGFAFYPGSDIQNADPRIQAALGANNTPAWRGLAYIVFYDLPLGTYQNSLVGAQVKVELMQKAAIYAYVYQPFQMPAQRVWQPPAWDGSVWCTVGRNAHKVAISTDGLTWAEVSLPTENGLTPTWADIASDAAGTLLITGDDGLANYILRSTNHGNTWAIHPLEAPYQHHFLLWGNNEWVLFPQGAQAYAPFRKSTNGISWTPQDLPYYPIEVRTNAVWHSGLGKYFVSTSYGGLKIYSSPTANSGTWTLVADLGVGYSNYLRAIVHKGRLLFLGTPSMVWSDDGLSWNVSAVPHNADMASDGEVVWLGTAGGNGSLYYSADGVTNWIQHNGPNQGVNHSPTAANGFVVFMCGGPDGENQDLGFRINEQFVAPQSVPLHEIVSSELLQISELDSGDINVGALSSLVRGYRIGSIGSIRSCIEPLRACWPFDLVQAGYVIKAKPRTGSAVATVTATDLGASGLKEKPTVQITMTRETDASIPRRLTVRHLDVDREYETGEQFAERLNTVAISNQVLEYPIALTASEAAGTAETLLYQAWLDRVAIAFALPSTYGAIEPTDIVNLPTPEGTISVRLEAIEYTSDSRLECKARMHAPAIYSPAAIGAASLVIPPGTITAVGASVYEILDVPYLPGQTAVSGVLVAMCGEKSGWAGGALIQSLDSGATWNTLSAFDPPGATIGTATNALGVVDSRLYDTASVLAIDLTHGDLFSISEPEMFGGRNAFAYGANGRWEIISARTCVLQSGSAYLLSGLLRGQLGTESAMGLHAVGDALILLDAADLVPIAMTTAIIGIPRDYRAITVYRDINTDASRAFSYQAVSLKPLSPIYLTGNRHPSTGDWSLTWVRRTRIGGEWRDAVDAELGETTEAYQVDIYTDGTFASIKRTLSIVAQACAYSSAEQVADFGSNQSTLHLKIYQMSSVVGRGFPLTESITR